jgi:hypothetical protein
MLTFSHIDKMVEQQTKDLVIHIEDNNCKYTNKGETK